MEKMDENVRLFGQLIPFISSYNFPIKIEFEPIYKKLEKAKIDCDIYFIARLNARINDKFYSDIYKLPEVKQWMETKYKTVKSLIMLHNNKIMDAVEKNIRGDQYQNPSLLSLFDDNLLHSGMYLYVRKHHILDLFPFNLTPFRDFNVFMNKFYVTTTTSFDTSPYKPDKGLYVEARQEEQLIPLIWYMNYDSSIAELIDEKTIIKLLTSNYMDTNFKFISIYGPTPFYDDENSRISQVDKDLSRFFEENNAKLLDSDPVLLFNDLDISRGFAQRKYLRIFHYNDDKIYYHKNYSDIKFFYNHKDSYLIIVVYSNEFFPEKILKNIHKNFKLGCSYIMILNTEKQ